MDFTEKLGRALLNADKVARLRGDKFGLCDCIDNVGHPYPSQHLADLLLAARSLGWEPKERLGKITIAEKWSTAKQWD